MVKDYTIEELKQRFKILGFKWYNLHIVGVRANKHTPDKFEDKIFLIWGASIYSYTGTTIPGVHWLQNLMNPKGTGIVVADQQMEDAYELGLHKGKEALIQIKSIKVWRDADKDEFAEELGAPVDAPASCRIDIHGTGPSIVSVIIGQWSAACQVLNNPKHWAHFMDKCKQSIQKKFTYTLLKEF